MKPSFDLTGKRAIVTGGTRGLGWSMAEGLMESGAEVCIVGSGESVFAAAEEFRARGFSCRGCRADLADAAQRDRMFREYVENMGGLEILLNAAGVQRRHFSEAFPIEDWSYVLEVNLTAVFALCQLAGQHFLQHGGGKIINIASMLSFFGGYTVPAYAASKGGVAQLTKALANEWSSKNIQVNAIAPGYMATEMNEALINDPGRNGEILSRIPARRWGTGEDMKGLAVFLASGASDYICGAVIPVDGGYLAR